MCGVQVLPRCPRLDAGLTTKTMTDAALPILRSVPEFIVNDPKGRNAAALPFFWRIRPCHTLAG
jgi:hypothetical protein